MGSSDSATSWWMRRRTSALVAGGVAAITVVGIAWASLLVPMDPPGTSCFYEVDPGSGPAGTGVERIDWNFGLFPERVCDAQAFDGSPVAFHRSSLFRQVWPAIAAVVALVVYGTLRLVVAIACRLRAVTARPDEEEDWRLTFQEEYLDGRAFVWRRWTEDQPGWDHDHCEFCWAKFAAFRGEDILHAGWVTADDHYHWVCERCFDDFRERFRWTIETGCDRPSS